MTQNDFNELMTAIRGELTRRGKGAQYTQYTVTPSTGVITLLEHPEKFFTNVKKIGTSRTDAVNAQKIVLTSDITSAIDYVKTLMAQNIK